MIEHTKNCLAVTECGPCDCNLEDKLIHEVERLSKLCEAKDKEFAQSEKSRRQYFSEMCSVIEKNDALIAELQAATAQIAMLKDVLPPLISWADGSVTYMPVEELRNAAGKGKQALSATSETTEAFLNEVRAKALEEAANAMICMEDEFAFDRLHQMSAELRAKNGG